MVSFFKKNDPKALEDFLYDLACEVEHPEQSDMLIEMMICMQPPLDRVRDDRWAVTPIDRARIHR